MSSQCAEDFDTWGISLKLLDAMPSPNCVLQNNCIDAGKEVVIENIFVESTFESKDLSNDLYQKCESKSQKKLEFNYCYMVFIQGKVCSNGQQATTIQRISRTPRVPPLAQLQFSCKVPYACRCHAPLTISHLFSTGYFRTLPLAQHIVSGTPRETFPRSGSYLHSFFWWSPSPLSWRLPIPCCCDNN